MAAYFQYTYVKVAFKHYFEKCQNLHALHTGAVVARLVVTNTNIEKVSWLHTRLSLCQRGSYFGRRRRHRIGSEIRFQKRRVDRGSWNAYS